MAESRLKLAVILGLLALAGPFAIDMYLPALPAIADELGASEAAAQYTLMAFFIPFGIAQMAFGPLADQIGRKKPLYLGMALFLVGSLGAALAGSIEQLLIWRAVQGAGGAVAMVVPRAIIRDVETGPAATRLMAMIMLVISVSPMVAPLAGSGVIAFAGWRAIFVVIAALAVLSVLLTRFGLPETLAVEHRVKVNLANMRKGMWRLLSHGRFVGLTLIGALGTSSFFIFIASAPFVYQQVFGFTPTQFSLAFAANAIGFFSASQAAGPLAERFGMRAVIFWGCSVFLAISAVLTVVVIGSDVSSLFVIGMLLFANAGLGLVIPTVMVMALDDHGEIAGLASSLGGTLQMTIAGLAIAVAGPFFDGTLLPMVGAIAVCALLTLAAALITLMARG